MAREQLERRHALHAASCSRTGPPGRRTVTSRCSSASARPPRRRSSSPRSPAATAPPTTGAGSSPRTQLHNDGLPRVALKMATGTGKTVVMAMLIAWQTINKVMTPKDARFAKRFLVVTPGITIRDRLGVLHPERDDNYYRERDLVPAGPVGRAAPGAGRDHQLPRLPAPGRQGDPGRRRQHPQAAARRAGRRPPTRSRRRPEMVAARDAAWLRHGAGARSSCSTTRPTTATRTSCWSIPTTRPTRRIGSATATPGSGSAACATCAARPGSRPSTTCRRRPYYLKGSGYNEGFIFPWVVSDFSLMDAIESGIVKIPRIPVDDDAAGQELVYLHLWDHIQPPLPKRRRSATATSTRAAGLGDCRRCSRVRCAASTAATQQNYARYETDAGGARRAAAGADRRVPEHDRLQARLRLDRRPGGRAARRQQPPCRPATSRC